MADEEPPVVFDYQTSDLAKMAAVIAGEEDLPTTQYESEELSEESFDGDFGEFTTMLGGLTGIVMEGNAPPEQVRRNQAIKHIHWEEGGLTRAGNKFTNWVLGLNLWAEDIQKVGTGAGLGGLIEYYSVAPQGGDPRIPGGTQILDFTNDADQVAFGEWLQNYGWQWIPEFRDIIKQAVTRVIEAEDPEKQTIEDDITRAIVENKVAGLDPEEAAPEEEEEDLEYTPALMQGLMAEFGDLIPDDDVFTDKGTLLQQAFEEAAGWYTARLAKESRWILVTKAPNDAILGKTNVAFVLSFDGTPYGDVNTIMDLFSGGQLGPPRADAFLHDLWRNDPNKFRQLQQELYALGYMDDPIANLGVEPLWGDISTTGPDVTLQAFHDLQVDMLAESVKAERNLESLRPLDIRARLVAKRARAAGEHATTEQQLRAEVANEIGGRALQAVEDLGQQITPKGQREIISRVNELVSEMSGSQQERLFGEGGTEREVALAEAVLAEFYGMPDWAEEVRFGHHDSAASYLNYARNVGAVSEKEYQMLESGTLTPNNYGRDKNNAGIRKDIATANFLKFLNHEGARNVAGDQVLDLAESVSNEQIERALVMYANTVGLANLDVANAPDYMSLVRRARNTLPALHEPNQELIEMGASVVEEMGIERSTPVVALDAIARSMSGVGRVQQSRIPNV